MTASSPALRALFQQRVAGDAALLELARLRFAQAGMAAEVYADTPEQLEHVLGFVPPHSHLPTVHLNRGVNVLHGAGRDVLEEFATRCWNSARRAGEEAVTGVHPPPRSGS